MTFRRSILTAAAIVVFLSGCSLPEFSLYSGQQQDWPTQPGSFINTQFALPIYVKSYPNRPYNVIGQLEWFTNRVGVNYVVRKAKALGADAMIVTGEQYVARLRLAAALQLAISIQADSMQARLA